MGTFAAGGASFFSVGEVGGPITAEAAEGRPVPEPPIALLLLTGMTGLIGWHLAPRCRAKALVDATVLRSGSGDVAKGVAPMVLSQGLIAASLLAIVLPAYADPNDITLDLSGVITSSVGGSDNTFVVGQPVTASILFDFSKETVPPFPSSSPNTFIFTGFGNYSLTIGPDHFTSANAPNNIDFALVDGGPGRADQLTLVDAVPFATNNPSLLIFDDLLITLNDPDGTGFTAGSNTFDPSKFTAGKFDASGNFPFTGGSVTGSVSAEAVGGRPVPEPPMALLLLTGVAGLMGRNLALRGRAKRVS